MAVTPHYASTVPPMTEIEVLARIAAIYGPLPPGAVVLVAWTWHRSEPPDSLIGPRGYRRVSGPAFLAYGDCDGERLWAVAALAEPDEARP